MSISPADHIGLLKDSLEELSHVAGSHKKLDLAQSNPSLNNSLQQSIETAEQRSRLGSGYTLANAVTGDLRSPPKDKLDFTLSNLSDAVELQAAVAETKASVSISSGAVEAWAKAQQEASDRISPIR